MKRADKERIVGGIAILFIVSWLGENHPASIALGITYGAGVLITLLWESFNGS